MSRWRRGASLSSTVMAEVAAWMRRWGTHIWMSANLLNDVVVKVARVAHHASGNVVGVLEAVEQLVNHGRLRALPQLSLGLLGGSVDVLDPVVVLSSEVGGDMVLELDHVAAGNLLCVGRGDDRRRVVVDRVNDDWRCRRQQRQCEAEEGLHGDGMYNLCETAAQTVQMIKEEEEEDADDDDDEIKQSKREDGGGWEVWSCERYETRAPTDKAMRCCSSCVSHAENRPAKKS